MRACMRACVRARVCLVVESVIDLFREEAGISGLREGSVEERKRERGSLSCTGERKEERKEKKETTRRWTDGWTERYHTCARIRRSGLPDGQRTNDRVLLRLPRPSYPKKERENERKREKSQSRRSSRRCSLLCEGRSFHSPPFQLE